MEQNFKKLLILFSFLFCLFLIPLSGQATYIPNCLYDNNQIQLGYYRQGVGVYVDKTSIVNEYYNPPYYKLAANVIYYNFNKGHEGILHEETNHYTHNINDGSIYVDSSMRGSLGPYYDRPSKNITSQNSEVKLAKLVWKTIYHMNWKW